MSPKSLYKRRHSLRNKIFWPFVVLISITTVLFLLFAFQIISKSLNEKLYRKASIHHTRIEADMANLQKQLHDVLAVLKSAREPGKSAQDAAVTYATALELAQKNGYEYYHRNDALLPSHIQSVMMDQDLVDIYEDNPSLYIFKASIHDVEAMILATSKGLKGDTIVLAKSLYEPVLIHTQAEDAYTALYYYGTINGKEGVGHETKQVGNEQKANTHAILDPIVNSEFIRSRPSLAKTMHDLITELGGSNNANTAKTVSTSEGDFHVNIERLSSHSQLYKLVLVPFSGIQGEKSKILGFTVVGLLILVVWVLSIYFIIIRQITSSIDILSVVARKVSGGDLNQKVYVDTRDEIGELSAVFNEMVANLKEKSTSLVVEKDRMEAILASLPEAIIVTDNEKRLMLANSLAEKMFKFSIEETKGKLFLSYVNHSELIKVLNMDIKKETPIQHDVSIPQDSGRPKIYSLSASVATSHKGEVLGVITIFRDITHEKELEELREGFLRTVSHEFRTPLTSIIGFIELVKQGAAGDVNEKQTGFLKIAHNEANNLKNLIDDLLDLSRIRAGKMKMVIASVNIFELVDSVIMSFMPLAKGKKITLMIDEDMPKELIVKGDASKIRRILINLVSNAIKFTPQGHVKVYCKESDHDIQLCVEDTGIGLLEDEKEIIFEKFRQVDYSSTRQFEGVGLGLSIVKQLVEMHKGKVWVESEYKKGSTFCFTVSKYLKA